MELNNKYFGYKPEGSTFASLTGNIGTTRDFLILLLYQRIKLTNSTSNTNRESAVIRATTDEELNGVEFVDGAKRSMEAGS